MRRIHRPVATTLVSLAAALAVAAMMSAVPGAIIAAPASFILIGFGGVGLGIETIVPIGIAVITAYLIIAFVRLYREEQEAM